MLIVVMMGKWSDDSACLVVHDVRLYNVLDTGVISGEDVCCNMVVGTLVGVFVFSVIWSELLTSAIGCPLWSSVYECPRVVGSASIYPVRTECDMCVVYCMQWCTSVSAVL